MSKRLAILWLLGLLMALGLRPAMAANSVEQPRNYRITINLAALRLFLYEDGILIHDYPIAVGKPATPTPVGEYRVVNKVHDPVWYPPGKKPVPPGPANPLGRWWLGLSEAGYGIHGCLDESSIGRPVSKGCIRLHNRDISQLAGLVGPGTPVTIADEIFAWTEDPASGRWLFWLGHDLYGRWPDPEAAAAEYLRAMTPAFGGWDFFLAKQGGKLSPGWHEFPRPIRLFRRDNSAGLAFLWQGQIWLPAEIRQGWQKSGEPPPEDRWWPLPGIAGETGEDLDWRYRPKEDRLVIYEARLRWGDKIDQNAVRFKDGRVMFDRSALAAMLGKDPLPGPQWMAVEEAGLAGWRIRWDQEQWEVVVERLL